MYSHTGKTALVTAASSGIGAAVARVLAENGARLLISSSNERRIGATAEMISGDTGSQVLQKVCNLSNREHVNALADYAVREFHRLDYLVINYGDPRLAPFLELSEGDWDASIDMFIGSTVSLVRKIVPYMPEKGGRIIFITSMTTRQANPGFALSGSLRAAVVNLGKILSIELGPRGLTVNSISQGYFMTDRIRGVADRNARINGTNPEVELEALRSKVPVGRIGDPREIGHLVSFLCSGDASYINGANIPIDGGVSTYPY